MCDQLRWLKENRIAPRERQPGARDTPQHTRNAEDSRQSEQKHGQEQELCS